MKVSAILISCAFGTALAAPTDEKVQVAAAEPVTASIVQRGALTATLPNLPGLEGLTGLKNLVSNSLNLASNIENTFKADHGANLNISQLAGEISQLNNTLGSLLGTAGGILSGGLLNGTAVDPGVVAGALSLVSQLLSSVSDLLTSFAPVSTSGVLPVKDRQLVGGLLGALIQTLLGNLDLGITANLGPALGLSAH
ncbi:hypothetical protein VTK73DRAFT_9475 [Phialemonium thermophilum]|uniref:Uncharacterized protein n=1 Tax=Phialemonium thermophilum TaxID=223376 RepID=A0ABR3Y5M0_9PEZI